MLHVVLMAFRELLKPRTTPRPIAPIRHGMLLRLPPTAEATTASTNFSVHGFENVDRSMNRQRAPVGTAQSRHDVEQRGEGMGRRPLCRLRMPALLQDSPYFWADVMWTRSRTLPSLDRSNDCWSMGEIMEWKLPRKYLVRVRGLKTWVGKEKGSYYLEDCHRGRPDIRGKGESWQWVPSSSFTFVPAFIVWFRTDQLGCHPPRRSSKARGQGLPCRFQRSGIPEIDDQSFTMIIHHHVGLEEGPVFNLNKPRGRGKFISVDLQP
jgi:hypothetical protein